MKDQVTFEHNFVEYIPKELEERKIYVSMEFATATHKCACGCGLKVVTPLSPTDWKLIFDGRSVSLEPSIGNWNFPCRSHYWIENNNIRWAARWNEKQINAGRSQDRLAKESYFGKTNTVNSSNKELDAPKKKKSLWKRFKQWWT